MVSKARSKVDPNIRDMFDAEVDKPEHDKVLTTLFQDDAAILSLLTAYSKAKSLVPFDASSKFVLDVAGPGSQSEVVNLAEAVRLTGVTPRWEAESALRLRKKRMESPILWSPEGSRTSRIIGFIDMLVGIDLIRQPSIHKDKDGTYKWHRQAGQYLAYFEIKGTWPTAGNLIRQLNLYRDATMPSFSSKPAYIVVGPDASMNALVCDHGYRLATFDASGTKFQLEPNAAKPVAESSAPGVF